MFGTSVSRIVTFIVIIGICRALERGDFTYQAALRSTYYNYCAGAILSDRWVLTSASCAMYSFFDIYLPVVVVGGLDNNEGTSYACDLVKKHDFFELSKYEIDIALVRTNHSILFNQFVQPIPYYKGFTANRIDNAVAVGWGFSSNAEGVEKRLNYKNVTVLSRRECVALWNSTMHPPSLPSTALCGKYQSETDDTTQFPIEFGRPVATSDSRVLFGIFAGYSWYYDRPDLYTGTADVYNWIFQISRVDGVIDL